MPDDVRQQRLPAFHVQIQRRAELFRVHFHDGVVAIFARLAELGDPLRLQIFDAERLVTVRARLDGNQMQNVAQPARDFRRIARFNVRSENAAVDVKS